MIRRLDKVKEKLSHIIREKRYEMGRVRKKKKRGVLGLYQAVELQEEGFNVYFEGGLRSDEHFNAQDYWLSISQEENIGLSGSHTSTIKSPILRVIHKMITYDTKMRMRMWLGLLRGRCRGKELELKRKVKFAVDSLSRRLLGSAGREYPELVFLDLREHLCMTDTIGWVGWRYAKAIERMEYREPTTHLVMLSRSMTSIISNTYLCHHNIHHSIISISRMMMSSVKTTRKIHAIEKERKARTILLMAIPKEHLRRFHGMDDAKEIWEAIRTRFGGAGKKEQKHKCLLIMDDGVVNWGEHTVEEEESNHALMAIRSNNEVSLCSKTCIDSYNKLKTLCDEQMNQLEDSIGKPLYSRFTKTNDFKGVPHPLSGDYTPTPQEEIDESLYVYGKKGPQEPEPSISDDRSSECSTCQSNDSEGSIGTSSKHSVDLESEISRVPSEVYVSTPITTTEKGVSAPKSKEVEPSCVSHIKTPRQPIKDQATPKVNRKNWNAMMERELGEGYSFTKKKCFVCGSLSHLIKDCDYYEKKMAREAEFKKQRVFNTGNGVAKPVWTNTDRINHANQFVPRPVQLNAGRPNINSVRPNINTGRTNINSVRPNINTGRVNVNSVKSNVNTGRTNVNPVRPRVNTGSSNVNTVRSRQPIPIKTSNNFSPKRP
ncbi:hypothetical protein Tco_0951056 [Tanacetum coccineum]|uniref:CCHC-type domain-containing protein n=1 Tax=Tanacetum coccineum TaxID=301880 RepID=A0ABQ5DT26_9ASTR